MLFQAKEFNVDIASGGTIFTRLSGMLKLERH